MKVIPLSKLRRERNNLAAVGFQISSSVTIAIWIRLGFRLLLVVNLRVGFGVWGLGFGVWEIGRAHV